MDSILSQYRKSHDIPNKIGLFTSPHLIAVRERIRINSRPISQELFAKYFFEVWDRLQGVEKPVYFRYLTLLSFHVFLQEGVDAAVYEVGVGGEYDSTNIITRPAVTGITSLGIDHTHTLGNTLSEIAWHKAGIQKPNTPSFTVVQQPAAMKVIEERAQTQHPSSLKVVKEDPRLQGVRIRPDAPFQRLNASLAVELANVVLTRLARQKMALDIDLRWDKLPKEVVDGLETVVWRGRCEKKVDGNLTWYLDGAHTADSILVATRWFGEECSQRLVSIADLTYLPASNKLHRPGRRVLIFNQQGHREAMALLQGLHDAITAQGLVKFDHVIFCPAASRADDAGSKRGTCNSSPYLPFHRNHCSLTLACPRFREPYLRRRGHCRAYDAEVVRREVADTRSFWLHYD